MLALLQAGAEHAELPHGYGVALLQTLVSLAAVCILAWVVLRWGAKRGLGALGQGKRIKVIEKVPLDARRSLYLVEVGGKVLLVGSGESGALSLLTELDPTTLPELPEPKPQSFADVLKRLAGKRDTAG
jgi:flagellar protein FliO/FliZ